MAAGPRMEPSVSDPRPMVAYPAAMPTAVPVLDPPAVTDALCGFFVSPCT
jgi:hypothetical protein